MLISDRLLYDADGDLTPVTDASQQCSKVHAGPAAMYSCTEASCAHWLAAYSSPLIPDNVLCTGHCTYTKHTEPPAADRQHTREGLHEVSSASRTAGPGTVCGRHLFPAPVPPGELQPACYPCSHLALMLKGPGWPQQACQSHRTCISRIAEGHLGVYTYITRFPRRTAADKLTTPLTATGKSPCPCL